MKLYAWVILVWLAVLFILPSDVQDIARRLLDDQLILKKHFE